jgi:hypothetical protein
VGQGSGVCFFCVKIFSNYIILEEKIHREGEKGEKARKKELLPVSLFAFVRLCGKDSSIFRSLQCLKSKRRCLGRGGKGGVGNE